MASIKLTVVWCHNLFTGTFVVISGWTSPCPACQVKNEMKSKTPKGVSTCSVKRVVVKSYGTEGKLHCTTSYPLIGCCTEGRGQNLT